MKKAIQIIFWTAFLYYRKVLRTSYNINTLHRNLHKANFAHEQRRGLKNVLVSDNVSNVRFCSYSKISLNSCSLIFSLTSNVCAIASSLSLCSINNF